MQQLGVKRITNYNEVHIRGLILLPVPGLLDVMTTHNDWWIYTTCRLLWVLTGWSQDKKCHWHYKESYGPLGRRSERSVTQLHTAGISTNMLFKWQQRAGLSPPRMGRGGDKTATWQRRGKENRCQCNLALNCKWSIPDFIQFLDLSHTMSYCESKESAA